MEDRVDQAAVMQLMEERRNPPSEDLTIGNERVDIELRGSGNGPFICRKKSWEWIVDEPPARGGRDTGANPLAYLISGAATCLLSHWMLYLIEAGAQVDGLKLRARMRFDRKIRGGKITQVIYDVSLASPGDREEILRLCELAQESCYAHNTLKAAGIPLTTSITLNGEPLATLVV
jgi:uncharacterized OsmC-like protein